MAKPIGNQLTPDISVKNSHNAQNKKENPVYSRVAALKKPENFNPNVDNFTDTLDKCRFSEKKPESSKKVPPVKS
ncbi:MAG: hypothetical protein JHC93_04900 [Parachlamydiales bacterium]|nr:hypothetical protein [Parachlamydiales bacterium]